jgi:hypothetical protein
MKRLMLAALATGCATNPGSTFDVHGSVRDVTHVVAASGTDRVIAAVDANGGFELSLAPGRAWTLSFADVNAPDMLVGTLRANGLDTLVPTAPGDLDLGKITMNGGFASAQTGYAELIGALGLDETAARTIALNDDLALRYANPDLDGNGEIDTVGYRLDIDATSRLTAAGRELGIGDVIRGTTPDGYTFLGTSIIAAVPGAHMQGATITFEQPFFGAYQGPDTPMVPANTAIGEPQLRIGALEGIPSMGVNARPTHDVPSGTYHVDIAGMPLTFTRVMPPSAARLTAGTGVIPAIHLVPTDPTCLTDCHIASVDLAWSDGIARPAQIDLLFAQGYVGVDMSEGSVPWLSKPARISGMTVADLAGVSTSQLCYVGITYEDPFGMRMTAQIANPECP